MRRSSLIPAGLLLGAALVTAPAPSYAAPTCGGKAVTIDLNVNPGALATAGDDVILGTPGHDLILGLGGKDTICGGGGPDNISGDEDADVVDGGFGSDVISGGADSGAEAHPAKIARPAVNPRAAAIMPDIRPGIWPDIRFTASSPICRYRSVSSRPARAPRPSTASINRAPSPDARRPRPRRRSGNAAANR